MASAGLKMRSSVVYGSRLNHCAAIYYHQSALLPTRLSIPFQIKGISAFDNRDFLKASGYLSYLKLVNSVQLSDYTIYISYLLGLRSRRYR